MLYLVFTTKYGRKLFTGIMFEQLRGSFKPACVKLECELIKMDTEEDHVHLLVAYSPKLSINVMVNNLKPISSRVLRIQNQHLTRQSKNVALWSRLYFACTEGDDN